MPLINLNYSNLLQIKPMSQRDPRWSNDIMGNSYFTVGEQGCLVTVASILLDYLGINIDPGIYNHLLSTNYGYAPPHNMYWKAPEILWAGQIKRAEYREFNGYTDEWQTAVDGILKDSRPALVEVRMGFLQHWVIVIGKVGNSYIIYDPWYDETIPLTKHYDKVYRVVSYKRVRAQ